MPNNTRRDFIKQAAAGTAAFLAYPPARVLGANDRIRVGIIGVGARGQELLKYCYMFPTCRSLLPRMSITAASTRPERLFPASKQSAIIAAFSTEKISTRHRSHPLAYSRQTLPGRSRVRKRSLLGKDAGLVNS